MALSVKEAFLVSLKHAALTEEQVDGLQIIIQHISTIEEKLLKYELNKTVCDILAASLREVYTEGY